MPYHGGHEVLVKLSTLLQSHGDAVLRQESQLCLTATSLVFLNQCFDIVNSGQQGTSIVGKRKGISYRDKEAITFLLDFLRRTPSLRENADCDERRALIVDRQYCCSHHVFVSKYSDVSIKDYKIYDEPLVSGHPLLSGQCPEGGYIMAIQLYLDTAIFRESCRKKCTRQSRKLVQGTCPSVDGLIDISCFRALQVLEIKKVPVGLIRGFQSLRPQLKTLICRKSLISLNEVLIHCGGDQLNAPFAWPHLENVDFSYNGIELLDDSVKLLPKLKVLNLSHNNIQSTEDDESHSLQYLSEVQHLNLGFNQMDSIPVPPVQAGSIKFKLTTLILRNNNLQNLKGIETFNKLRLLDVSFNCIASLAELTPLAHLHNLISLNLEGNPVVFCPYYRRATIACLYPIPRVEPIQIDGKPLDSEEQILLGRNVQPVSMLSYIPEPPLPHPRVKAVRQVAEDLMESSESQEESGSSTPKPRKYKKKGKKGKRLVAREIDFDDESEVVSEDQPSTTPCPTPIEQVLEHEDDVEQLKKLRQLGGEGWLPSISQVVPDKDALIPSVQSPPDRDRAASIVRTESVASVSEDRTEITSPRSSISVISDEDISDAQHFLVTLLSTPEDDDGSAVPLFLTVKNEFIVEKNFAGKVISQLETSCLQEVWVDSTTDDHNVVHIRFDYINPDRQTRDYIMESQEDSRKFADILRPFVTMNKEIKLSAVERLQCLKCSAEFTRPIRTDDPLCPDCGSSMTVLATSPNQEKQEKRVLPIRTVGDYLRERTEGSTLNTSSVKSLNGNMSITPLVNMSSSSSSSSYVDASDQQTTQETAKGENSEDFFESNAPPTDKQEKKNIAKPEDSPDVIPRTRETLEQPSNVPDLCSNASGNVSNHSEKAQKKFIITNRGNFKVASDNNKYSLGKKTINATQVRTSALSNSLKESKYSKLPQMANSPPRKFSDYSNGVSHSRMKSAEDVIDGYPSTPSDRRVRHPNRKLRYSNGTLRDHDKKAELLSQSLPAYGNTSSNGSLHGTPTRKRSEQKHSSFQQKISQNGNTPKDSDSTSNQTPQSTSLSSSPTPKMFFNNLINRLSGRLSGSGNSASSSDSRSSSNSSSRASTPTMMEQNVVLSFRLSADEFSSCDHKLKLYFEVSLFRWGNHEEFCCLLKAPVVVYGSTEETPALMITSNVMFYICRFALKGSGTPDECLTPLVSHPLDDLQFIDSGLGGQSFRLEFSAPGRCYEFLVREKDRCERFLNLFINTVQQAKLKAGSKPATISAPHPQTLEHIRSQVFGNKVEDPCFMGERLRQQVLKFTDPPLIKDRKSLLRSYSSCFVGREFVDWMIQVKEAETRDEAVEIGQRLLDAGAVEHVSKEPHFEDKDQYYRFNTETDLLKEATFADSVPDMDTNIILFIMAHRCTDTTKPHFRLDAVSVVVSRSHIALVKQNPQWPAPRYTEMPQDPKGPAFLCLAKHKITDITSLDFYEDNPCFMGISITDEDAPAHSADSQWILKTETVSTLSSLVKVIKVPWEKQFGVELQKNLYPTITEHRL